jgi:hypothetical protein
MATRIVEGSSGVGRIFVFPAPFGPAMTMHFGIRLISEKGFVSLVQISILKSVIRIPLANGTAETALAQADLSRFRGALSPQAR